MWCVGVIMKSCLTYKSDWESLRCYKITCHTWRLNRIAGNLGYSNPVREEMDDLSMSGSGHSMSCG